MHTHTVKTAVYCLIKKDGKYLFLRRFNTGWEDGKYTIPAGHIDEGEVPTETAVREIKEEVGIDVSPEDLGLVHVHFDRGRYIDFYFEVSDYEGEPTNMEKNKSDDLVWESLDNDLEKPEKIQLVLDEIIKGNIYSHK